MSRFLSFCLTICQFCGSLIIAKTKSCTSAGKCFFYPSPVLGAVSSSSFSALVQGRDLVLANFGWNRFQCGGLFYALVMAVQRSIAMTAKEYQRATDLFWIEGSLHFTATLDDDGGFYTSVRVGKGQHDKLIALVAKIIPKTKKINELSVELESLYIDGELHKWALK